MSRKWTVSAASSSARPGREQQLHAHDHREPQQLQRIERALIVDEEGRQNRQAEEEVHEIGEHRDDRQHLGREQHLLDQVPARDQHVGRLGQRRAEPGPRQDAAEEEQPVGTDVLRVLRRHDDGEHERVHQQQEQRVEERPEEPEDRAAVARLQVAGNEGLDEAAVVQQGAEVVEHRVAAPAARPRTSLSRPASHASPGFGLQLLQRPAAARPAPARSRSRAAAAPASPARGSSPPRPGPGRGPRPSRRPAPSP